MSVTYIPPKGEQAAYRAGRVMISPDRIEQNACIETCGNRVAGISKSPPSGPVTDLGPGLIMPLLVNAHTHLELSALKGRLDTSRGFEAWVQDLIGLRQELGNEALAAAAAKEMNRLHAGGTGAVAEISTLGLTREIMVQAGLAGIWFQELLGGSLPPELADLPENNFSGESGAGLFSVSLAGHAPHTTSPELLTQAKEAAAGKGLPFSIHLAESEAEQSFIQGENRSWTAFLQERGIRADSWPVGDKTPVQYLADLGLLGPGTLGVHLIHTCEEDLDLLAQTGTRICLCPRSNQALHGRLPDIPAMLARNLAPSLGTDSLASCDSLSLFDEMAFIRDQFPGIPPREVLTMAGINGARALGLSGRVGILEKGAWAGMLYVEMPAATENDILESLTTYDF